MALTTRGEHRRVELRAPGRTITSTPAKPATIAIQRPASSFSPRNEALTSAMISGTEKKIDEVTVSCRYCSAQKLMPVIAMNISARTQVPAQVAGAHQRQSLEREQHHAGDQHVGGEAQPDHHDHRHAPTSHLALPSSSENSR